MLNMKKKIFGIDIGKRSIKGVLLSKKGTEVFLDDYLYFDLQETNNMPTNQDQQLTFLSALVDGVGLKDQMVAASVDDKEVQILNLSMPKMPENELTLAIKNEIEAKTGINAADVSMDYLISNQLVKNGAHNLSLNVFFSRLETIKEHVKMLETAHLRPVSLESSMQSTVEMLRFNEYVRPSDTHVVVDIGEFHTSLGLVVNGNLVQMNTLRQGSGDINEKLMERFRCNYKESELMKLSFKIEKEESNTTDIVSKVIEEGYYQLIVGIHDTIAYYRASHKDSLIMNVILTGGGAQKEGLAEMIEQGTNIPTELANPLRKIQIFHNSDPSHEKLPQLGAYLHSAIGLALRGV